MKIGYPCINRQLNCTPSATFRLKNYSAEKLEATVASNLSCLQANLTFNIAHALLFFRISSDTVPFASHPICDYPWLNVFKKSFEALGTYIKKHDIRISMHPSQFVIINALDTMVIDNSVRELQYHAQLLDAMELDETAKIQIHVGGLYGDKSAAIQRFIHNYKRLPNIVQRRLVIENDDRLFSLADCLLIHEATAIPILFDNLHHECLHNQESLATALSLANKTWRSKDGVMLVDYSSQAPASPRGKHAESLDDAHFQTYLQTILKFDCDIMLEIKDKERSALRALQLLQRARTTGLL